MSNTLRLIYPQWQGGVISPLVPELTPADANLGYVLGSQLLDFLAPKNAWLQRMQNTKPLWCL